MPTVLLLADADERVKAGARLLQQHGYDVLLASCGRNGIKIAGTRLESTGEPGVPAAARAGDGRVAMVTFTHAGDGDPDAGALRAVEYVHLPVTDPQLVEAVERAAQQRPAASGVAEHAAASAPSVRVMVLISEASALHGRAQMATKPAAEAGDPAVALLGTAATPQTTLKHVRELAARNSKLKIIVVDETDAGVDVVDLIDAGAAGVLPAGALPQDVVYAVRLALGGATVLPAEAARSLVTAMTAGRRVADDMDELGEGERMTRREQEIVALIADGLSNKEIATRLSIATLTVKSHVHNVLQKLGLQTRAQIARDFLLRRTGALPFSAAGQPRSPART